MPQTVGIGSKIEKSSIITLQSLKVYDIQDERPIDASGKPLLRYRHMQLLTSSIILIHLPEPVIFLETV